MLIKTLVLFYRCLYFLFCRKKLRLMRFETAEIGILRAEKITLDVYVLDQLREYTRLARTKKHNQMSLGFRFQSKKSVCASNVLMSSGTFILALCLLLPFPTHTKISLCSLMAIKAVAP